MQKLDLQKKVHKVKEIDYKTKTFRSFSKYTKINNQYFINLKVLPRIKKYSIIIMKKIKFNNKALLKIKQIELIERLVTLKAKLATFMQRAVKGYKVTLTRWAHLFLSPIIFVITIITT